MRIKLLFFFLAISLSAVAQNTLNIPGFGNIPFIKTGDLYALDFGKLGKFNFSGTINPLSLSTNVEMDDLKTFPGAKVMAILGLQDIEMILTSNDFEIAANLDDKFKDDILDEIKKIDIIAPVIGTVLNTFEMRESKVSLTFDKSLKMIGEIDFNIHVFGKKLPIPKINGELNPQAIIGTIVDKVKDVALNELSKVAKVVAEAMVESGKIIAGAFDDAMKVAKTASTYVTSTKSQIDNKYVPRHATKVSKPVLLASNRAIGTFYDKVTPALKNIEGKTNQETKELRSKYIKTDWNKIIRKIDNDWNRIRGDRSYVSFYIKPSSAANGGNIFRKKVDEYKQQHIDFRNRIWNRMMNDKELIVKNNDVYFVKSVSQGKWWDMPNFHYNAGRYNAHVGLYKKDNYKGKYEGADRFIKIIRTGNPDIVFLQPQHSYYVIASEIPKASAGTKLVLDPMDGSKKEQMFKMKPVSRKKHTYYLIHVKSGLSVTANPDGSIELQNGNRSKSQQWKFEDASNANLMAAPDTEYRFMVENVKAKRIWDIPGAMRDVQGRGAKLQLWDIDDCPDRFMSLEKHEVGDETYFYIRILHHDYVLNVTDWRVQNGTRIELWDKQNEMKQQFKFIYAGAPLTYYIQDRNSGKFLNANSTHINENGCAVQIWDFNGQDQQKWKLHMYKKWQVPRGSFQKFHIKAAFTNNEYWDISGSESHQGSKIQNYALDGGQDRLFRIKKTNDYSWINIQSAQNGMMVDVPNNTDKNGTQIQLWPKNGADAQKFGLELTSETTFTIYTKRGKSIDIDGDPYNGTDWRGNSRRIQINNYGHTQDRHWQLYYADGPKKGQVYRFKQINPESSKAFIPQALKEEALTNHSTTSVDPFLGKTFIIQSSINFGKNPQGCWDIPGGKNPPLGNGKNVEVWQENGGLDQHFTVIKGTIDGYYKLAPSNSPKYRINVDGGNTNNGTNLELWENNNNPRQNFMFKHLGNGKFKIYDSNGRALCLSARSSNNGSNIHIWEDHNGPWMEWYLIDAKTRKPYTPQAIPHIEKESHTNPKIENNEKKPTGSGAKKTRTLNSGF